MSTREQLQQEIVDWLSEQKKFNAPYGVLPGLKKIGKGAVRIVTFGVARYLDATILIWTPKRIQVQGQGGLAYKYDGNYSSWEELKKVLEND